jgi:hypothetical protein
MEEAEIDLEYFILFWTGLGCNVPSNHHYFEGCYASSLSRGSGKGARSPF